MAKNNIYQIYYNEETLASLDSGFIPLDNSENLQPDWGEFCVIRNFLKNNHLNDNERYGFFSPKFHHKTGLSSAQVYKFLETTQENTDVVLFSPFWELNSFFKNVFEQGEFWHPGLTSISQEFFSQAGKTVDPKNIIMHSANTVFCNYFLAKPVFWKEWLNIGDFLFFSSENKKSLLSQHLEQKTLHDNRTNYSFKIFLQERLASYLLSTAPWKTEIYPFSQMKNLISDLTPFRRQLVCCDALKAQYARTGQQDYLNEYFGIRSEIASLLKIQFPQ